MTNTPEFSSLKDRLAAQIEASGPLRLDAYMAACLTDPDFGYYLHADPLGRSGDFITAPEISQIFGELLGLWAVVVWQQMGQPRRLDLVELGPGRGTLMADALRAGAIAPGFLEAVRLFLVEASPLLRDKQAESLAGAGVEITWAQALSDLPPARAGEGTIVLANEFLDALPIRQFEQRNGAWFERLVGLGPEGALAFELAAEPASPGELPPLARSPQPEGAVIEFCPALPGLVSEIARRGEKAPLAALFIDYGPARSAAGDSFQAVRGHASVPVLETPGQADLTAHVDFGTLARLAADEGMKVFGPLSQGHFLLALGLHQRSQQLMKDKPLARAQEIARAAGRLVDPAQMGALFKALVLTRGISQVPPPFDAVPEGRAGRS